MGIQRPDYTANGQLCQAVFPFQGQEVGDLSFEAGDIITLIAKHESGWWTGKTQDGRSGEFPYNYVEEIKENPVTLTSDLDDLEARLRNLAGRPAPENESYKKQSSNKAPISSWSNKVSKQRVDIIGKFSLMKLKEIIRNNQYDEYGIDPSYPESYLNDKDFELAFNVNRENFYKLPRWKQGKLKRDTGLWGSSKKPNKHTVDESKLDGSTKKPKTKEAVLEQKLFDEIRHAVKSNSTAPYSRIKLMVIGEGRAGKTSTIKSLMRLPFNYKEESTRGATVQTIDTRDWKPDDSANDFAEHLHKAVHQAKNNKGGESIENQHAEKKSGIKGIISNYYKTKVKGIDKHDDKKKSIGVNAPSIEPEEVRVMGNALISWGNQNQDSKIALSIWDYGGQEVFYTLHHLFLTNYGVYMLAFNMKSLIEKETIVETIRYLKFWLNSKKLHAGKAAIIIVGTHLDYCPTVNEQKKIDSILKMELNAHKSFNLVFNTSKKYCYFPINNLNGDGISTLRSIINDEIAKSEFVQELVPVSWLRSFDFLLKKHVPFLQVSDIENALREKCGLSRDDFYSMLEFFHERGMITYFRYPDTLSKFIVLEPQWLIDGVTKVIFDPKLHGDSEDIDQYELEDGLITDDVLSSVWSSYDNQVQEFLKEVMKKMLLLCSYQDDDEETMYVVPSLVQFNSLEDENIINGNYDGHHFVIDFSSEYLKKKQIDELVCYLPFGIFERLVCLCITHSTCYFGSMMPSVRKNYAKLSFGNNIIFELVKDGDKIKVQMKRRNTTTSHNARELVQIIYEMIQGLKEDFIGKKLSMLLLLPSDKGVFAPYQTLVEQRNMKAQLSYQEFFPNRKRSIQALVSDYDFWFETEVLNDMAGPNMVLNDNFLHEGYMNSNSSSLRKNAPVNGYRALDKPYKYHVFISYKQADAIDIVGTLSNRFELEGFKVWFDQNYKDQITKESMSLGIKDSKYYVLFLSRTVFESEYVRHEISTALALGKPIFLIHHPDTNTERHCTFGEYIQSAQKYKLNGIFENNESMQFRRRGYEQRAMMNELMRRFNQRRDLASMI